MTYADALANVLQANNTVRNNIRARIKQRQAETTAEPSLHNDRPDNSSVTANAISNPEPNATARPVARRQTA